MLNKIIFILYFVKVFFYEKNHFICYCFLSKLIISLYIDNIHTIFSCFKSYRRKVFAGGIPIFFSKHSYVKYNKYYDIYVVWSYFHFSHFDHIFGKFVRLRRVCWWPNFWNMSTNCLYSTLRLSFGFLNNDFCRNNNIAHYVLFT